MGLFPRRPKPPTVNKAQALNARPVRNPAIQWERDDEGLVVFTIHRRSDWVGKLMSILFVVPESRKIVLDEVGSDVWSWCDGRTTLLGVIDRLCETYHLNRKEAEVSVTKYLRDLAKRGIVGFAIEEPQPSGKAQQRSTTADG